MIIWGGEDVASGKMKSTSGLWDPPNTGATDVSGWFGLPGGSYLDVSPFSIFEELGKIGYWWSPTLYKSDTAGHWHLNYYDDLVVTGLASGAFYCVVCF